mmetsp:Transcript_39860/g.105714  ORF Transcript_39860/g.105714 Transcript_39860/m.105714 type:complete len:161 (-) Transcript_39860:24-506(-)
MLSASRVTHAVASRSNSLHTSGVVIGNSVHGLGVFAARAFEVGDVIDVCPCVRVPRSSLANVRSEGARLEGSVDLRDYFFESTRRDVMLMPLGCGMAYNHGGNEANAKYDIRKQTTIVFRALCSIDSGDEILIDYGEDWWMNRGWLPMRNFMAHGRGRKE